MAFSKLWIPRKEYMTRAGKVDIRNAAKVAEMFEQMARDEIANYLAIQGWANSLTAPAGSPHPATVVVAASNSTAASKASADFVCTGTNDGTTINSAITQAKGSPSGRGNVLLLEGDFFWGNIASVVSTNLVGIMGLGGNVANGTPITNIQIDSTYTRNGLFNGAVYLKDIGFTNTGQVGATGAVIGTAQMIVGCKYTSTGTFVNASGFSCTTFLASHLGGSVLVFGNEFSVDPTSSAGVIVSAIQVSTANDRPIVFGNRFTLQNGGTNNAGNLMVGILVQSDSGSQGSGQIIAHNRVVGTQNTIQAYGIALNNSPGGTKVMGNSIELGLSQALGGDGINLNPVATGSTTCDIMHNTVRRTGAAGTMRYGINLPAGANNNLVVHNDLRTSGGTASLNNAGAGNFLNMDASANNWNLL